MVGPAYLFDDREGDLASLVRPEDVLQGFGDDRAEVGLPAVQVRHQELEAKRQQMQPVTTRLGPARKTR